MENITFPQVIKVKFNDKLITAIYAQSYQDLIQQTKTSLAYRNNYYQTNITYTHFESEAGQIFQ